MNSENDVVPDRQDAAVIVVVVEPDNSIKINSPLPAVSWPTILRMAAVVVERELGIRD